MALREIFADFGFSWDRSALSQINAATNRVTGSVQRAATRFNNLTGGVAGFRAAGLDAMQTVGRFAGTAVSKLATETGTFIQRTATMSRKIFTLRSDVSLLQTGFQTMGSVIAGSMFVGFLNGIEKTGSELKDLSEQTDIDTKTIQVFKHTLSTMGVEAGESDVALRKFALALSNADDGGKEQLKTLKALGVETAGLKDGTKTAGQVLDETFAAFGNVDPIKRAALAQDLFGRGAVKLLPLLAQGKEGIAAARAELEALGGGFSEEGIEAADAYGDSLARLQTSFTSFKSGIAVSVFPTLTRLIDRSSAGIGKFKKWAEGTTLFKTGLLALAAAIAGPFLKALAPLLLPGLKFLAIFLAVDDLIAFLQGKKSVIERILEGIKPGSAKGVRDFANNLRSDIDRMIGGLKGDNAQGVLDLQIIWQGWLDGSLVKQWETAINKIGNQMPGLVGVWFKWVGFMIRVWVTFTVELFTGFQATQRGLSVISESIAVKWNETVLSMLSAWNGFVESVLGTNLSSVLKIDTSGAKADLDASKQRLENLRKQSVVPKTAAEINAIAPGAVITGDPLAPPASIAREGAVPRAQFDGPPAAIARNADAIAEIQRGVASLQAASVAASAAPARATPPAITNNDNRKIDLHTSVPVQVIRDRGTDIAGGARVGKQVATAVEKTNRRMIEGALVPAPAQ